MKLLYLDTTTQDIAWISHYYEQVFPEGRLAFRKHFYAMEELLKENPLLGVRHELFKGVRELRIYKTPFSFIYRVKNDHIEVLRIWDQRRDMARLRDFE